MWPPPTDLVSSHPALKRVLDAHLTREKRQSAALKVTSAAELQQPHASIPAYSGNGSRFLHTTMTALLRARGASGTLDDPEALLDLRVRPFIRGQCLNIMLYRRHL